MLWTYHQKYLRSTFYKKKTHKKFKTNSLKRTGALRTNGLTLFRMGGQKGPLPVFPL